MFSGRAFSFLFAGMILFSPAILSQSLKGKTIYVSPSQEVMVKFPSVITNYNFVNKEAANLFETRITNNKNFSINSTAANFKSTNLIVTEGGNSHLFIIEFKESLDARTESLYDYSRRKDLAAEAARLAKGGTSTAVSQPPPAQGGPINKPPEAVTKPPVATNTDNNYSDLQTRGNKAFLDGKYDEAKDFYTKALALRPNEKWPAEQLLKIEEKKTANAKMGELKKLEAEYQRHKSIGDSAFFKKAYDLAKVEYTEARKAKPEERYAAMQIVKINKILDEDDYKNYMKYGREALSNKMFNEAEEAFNKALKAKPFDGAAKKELQKIEAAKKTEAKKVNEVKLNDSRLAAYNDSITLADNLYQSGSYLEARKSYKNAEKLKPGEPYTSRKIKQIDSILIKEKTAILNRDKEKANVGAYNRAIETGDKAFEAKDYNKAKLAFQQAISFNSNEKYPVEKISVIDVLLQQEADAKKEALTLKQKAARDQKQYDLFVKQGNTALAKKEYHQAKNYFMQAMELKPFEKVPMTQLEKIHKKLDELLINSRYEMFIHLADSTAFTAKDRAGALQWYDSATVLKPAEAYPKNQIKSIESDLLIASSRLLEQQQQTERTAIYNQYFPEYKKADEARLMGKYPEAYTGFSRFLAGMDTANSSKYLPSQRYHIKQALDYVNRLEAYKPKPVIENVKPETPNDRKNRRNRKNS